MYNMQLSEKDLELLIKMKNLIGYNENILFGEDKSFAYEEDIKISHDDFLEYKNLIENLIIINDKTLEQRKKLIKSMQESVISQY